MLDLEFSAQVAVSRHDVDRLAILETCSQDLASWAIWQVDLRPRLDLESLVQIDEDRTSESLRAKISKHDELVAHDFDLNHFFVAACKASLHAIFCFEQVSGGSIKYLYAAIFVNTTKQVRGLPMLAPRV